LRATIKGLLPGTGVGCPPLIGDQAYSFVLDGCEAVLTPTLGKGIADVTDKALHHGQYGHVMLRVNQRSASAGPSAMAERDPFGTVHLVCNLGRIGTNEQGMVEVRLRVGQS
jgi:hypothetical protein